MAVIAHVNVGMYKVPLAVPLSDSNYARIDSFELVTVRLSDVDGATGLGYTYTVNSGGLAIRSLIADYLAVALAGQEAENIEALWRRMWKLLYYPGRGGHQTAAIAAVDTALWDLKARRLGTPLWHLFGGFDSRVPVYAGGVDLNFSLAELLKQADTFVEAGYRAIKMKVGRPRLSEDLERVHHMREHLGADFPLMVDANMAWNASQAVTAARSLRDFNLVWLEEPTVPEDLDGYVRVIRDGGIPVAGGENLHTLSEFKAAIACGALSYPEPDISNSGGPTVFRKIAALAEAYQLPLASHGVHDLTIHCMAAAPTRTYMEVHGFSLAGYMTEPLSIADGCMTASDRPGHGVELDFAALGRHAV